MEQYSNNVTIYGSWISKNAECSFASNGPNSGRCGSVAEKGKDDTPTEIAFKLMEFVSLLAFANDDLNIMRKNNINFLIICIIFLYWMVLYSLLSAILLLFWKEDSNDKALYPDSPAWFICHIVC